MTTDMGFDVDRATVLSNAVTAAMREVAILIASQHLQTGVQHAAAHADDQAVTCSSGCDESRRWRLKLKQARVGLELRFAPQIGPGGGG
jgi:hypothetical protein